jgi:hypothetical protein
MKKFICCLVITMSLLLSTPMSYGSCEGECNSALSECASQLYQFCLQVCGQNQYCWQVWCASSYASYCIAPYQECLDECQ